MDQSRDCCDIADGYLYSFQYQPRCFSLQPRGEPSGGGEGQYDRAIACLDKAIKVESKFPEAYCNRETAYYEKGQYAEAIRDFDRAIELKPEFAEAYYNRAMVYYHQKQYSLAWDDVNRAQSLGHFVSANLLEALQEATGREH